MTTSMQSARSTSTRTSTSTSIGLGRVLRLAASVLVLMMSAYYLVVAFDNITNPDSNWAFVHGVMDLDGVFKGSGFGWRAVDVTWLQMIGYVGIIVCESVAGLILLLAGILGLARSPLRQRWADVQRWTILGTLVGLLVFFLGFITVGGNWFVMYLNSKWNGLDPAFQNSVMNMLVVLFVLGVIVFDRILVSTADRVEQE